MVRTEGQRRPCRRHHAARNGCSFSLPRFWCWVRSLRSSASSAGGQRRCRRWWVGYSTARAAGSPPPMRNRSRHAYNVRRETPKASCVAKSPCFSQKHRMRRCSASALIMLQQRARSATARKPFTRYPTLLICTSLPPGESAECCWPESGAIADHTLPDWMATSSRRLCVNPGACRGRGGSARETSVHARRRHRDRALPQV